VKVSISPPLFQCLIGVEPLVLEYVWKKYGGCLELSERSHLLMLFNWMKEYPTQDSCSVQWNTTRQTFSKKLWKIIFYLDSVMDEISFSKRLQPPIHTSNWGSVTGLHDATECPLTRPSDPNLHHLFYSGKKKSFTIKYEVTVCPHDGMIWWCAGGVPGKIHDLTLLRHYHLQEQLMD